MGWGVSKAQKNAARAEKYDPTINDGTNGYDQQGSVINPVENAQRPMGSYNNTVSVMVDQTGQPNLIPGPLARDYDHTPIIFQRLATRWGDLQLKNGLANGVGSGKIWGYRGEGWADMVVPVIPGQMRQIGVLPSSYPIKGPAPSQVQNAYQSTAGQQPMYPGGPGQMYNTGAGPVTIVNPGSGG
jgi:hypothetical protein